MVGDRHVMLTCVRIEHLPPPALCAFAPTLLGLYRPRLLLVTTPNYEYNARFSAPNAPSTTRIAIGRAFLDPTGRTTRVFRHSDHKFEWTPSELSSWAHKAAIQYGYEVNVGAIGRAEEEDPWGRDEELGRATQTVLFRRKGCKTNIEEQESNVVASRVEAEKHVMVKTWYHKAHQQAGRSQATEVILHAVASYMEGYYFEQGYTIWDLWVEISIAAACGGNLDVLIRTLEAAARAESGVFTLAITGAKPTLWVVKFRGEKHHEAVSMQKSRLVWDDYNVASPDAESDQYNLVRYTETDRDIKRVDEEEQDQQKSSSEEECQHVGDEDGIAGSTSNLGTWGSESSPSWIDSGGWS